MTQTLNIPTLQESIDKHNVLMTSNGTATMKDIKAADTFDKCYACLYNFISVTPDVTTPSVKSFLYEYEGMLRFIKMVNRPVYRPDKQELYEAAYQTAYNNFLIQNA